MTLSAYKRTITETENPKQIERRVMTRVNSHLVASADTFDAGDTTLRLQMLSDGLRAALADNEKLWATLKQDLISPSNKMPQEMRASLISLGMFVERHTGSVLSGKGELRPLINVNNAIISGLSGVAAEEVQ